MREVMPRNPARKRFSIFSVAAPFVLCCVLAAPLAQAKSTSTSSDVHRFIIELRDLPVSLYDGRELNEPGAAGVRRLAATAPEATGDSRLNTRSGAVLAYREYLAGTRAVFLEQAGRMLGRPVEAVLQYDLATNGMAVELTDEEADLLKTSPMVRFIEKEEPRRIDTYAAPAWVGAELVWNGDAGFTAAKGENIVIGIIDSGINWDSPSFMDPAPDGYMHENPFGRQLGLCSNAEVGCNNKLIGVFDYITDDDPNTEDVVEESTNGRDVNGHGSHVASIAAGNPVAQIISGGEVVLSGVAPRANLVTYRICHDENCYPAYALQAIQQAIEDGIDVLNYSIGGDADDPWLGGTEDRAFLGARAAGIVSVTSAGNSGPETESIGSPANSPWIVSVGNATHNAGGAGSVLQNMSGGATAAPGDMIGASYTRGTGKLVIVHAADYGNALCGEGPAESQPTCGGNTGASNPWAGEKPFNGEIVVCDRGTYGRVEKGKNVLLAGAGGYVLANTAQFGESVVADDHCLPAVHIGEEDGNELRAWLDSGIGHGASISGYMTITDDKFADKIISSSSRGPMLPPVEDTLKPNLFAPGVQILGASHVDDQYVRLNGTSMSSPNVAGGIALVKSVHPDWNPSQLISSIELTATTELAEDNWNLAPATPHVSGNGRPRLGEAVNAGLYLNETSNGFALANPAAGGEPRDLNLAAMVDASCVESCTFVRTVTDQMGGGNWSVTLEEFPQGITARVTPSSFSLGNRASQDLSFQFDLGAQVIVGNWYYGKVRLSAAGSPDLLIPVALNSSAGEVPDVWYVNSDSNGGWQQFQLDEVASVRGLALNSGGLTRPETVSEVLIEDPTNLDPYDGGEGVMTELIELPQGALWLHVETLDSTAPDVDLYVGRDHNGNGVAEEWEELCQSTSPNQFEQCELYDVGGGTYWALAQNWRGSGAAGDEVTLRTAAVSMSDDGNLAVSGPGITETNQPFDVRLSWDNVSALPGETWFGAVAVGSHEDFPTNIGIIPIRFWRSGISAPETFPLMEGTTHKLALAANSTHDRMFIDIPPGVSSLTIFTNGATADQNTGLTMTLKRLDYAEALSEPPFAVSAASSPGLISAEGNQQEGPSITVIGVESGRWYAELSNRNDTPSSVEIRAEVEYQGAPIESHPGLWEPISRPGIGQGYDYNWGNDSRALIWYTYDEDGQPDWYIAGAPHNNGNIWTTDLLRFTNDGSRQRSAPVGQLSVTQLATNDALFSYTLYGKSGTERMVPLSAPTCPQVNGPSSYTGIWYRGVDGLGGASVLVNEVTQAQIHYLYDAQGYPRWLFAQDPLNNDPNATPIPMLQFQGFCAVCDSAPVDYMEVGTLDRNFDSETSGSWTLDYSFDEPPIGSANRSESIVKLTQTIPCQ
jgi:subtilisin family serine protease